MNSGYMCAEVIRLGVSQNQNDETYSKHAHVHEQSEFTHIGSLVAAGHVLTLTLNPDNKREREGVPTLYICMTCRGLPAFYN